MKKVFSAMLLAASITIPAAEAATMLSTKLADIARYSRVVVQGEVIATKNLIDQTEKGRPWTIYTLLVERVLAGEVTDTEFSFRCLGGTYADGHLLGIGGGSSTLCGRLDCGFHRRPSHLPIRRA